MKITEQKRNELLQREEISALKEDFKTPSMVETKTELANLLKRDAEVIVVKKIKGRFGNKRFIIEAYAYDNKEVMKKIEPKIKEKKKEAADSEGTQQAKTEEKAEEKK